MDLPYNLFPSLHIALGGLLAVTYARHTRGVRARRLASWFVLIAASAVLTYQHHVLDVVGGFALGGLLLLLHPRNAGPAAVRSESHDWRCATPRRAICAARAALSSSGRGARCFFGQRSRWRLSRRLTSSSGRPYFAKTNGVVPWSTWWALGPFLLGQHLSRLYYRRQCRAWDQVTPNVWIGSALNEREARSAVNERRDRGPRSHRGIHRREAVPRDLIYRNIPILDLTAPTLAQLEEIAAFITEQSDERDRLRALQDRLLAQRGGGHRVVARERSGERASPKASRGCGEVRPSIVVRPEIPRCARMSFVLAAPRARRHVIPSLQYL